MSIDSREYKNKHLSEELGNKVTIKYSINEIVQATASEDKQVKAKHKKKSWYSKLNATPRRNFILSRTAVTRDKSDNVLSETKIAEYSFHIDPVQALSNSIGVCALILSILAVMLHAFTNSNTPTFMLLILATLLIIASIYMLYDNRFTTCLVFKENEQAYTPLDVFRKPTDQDGVISTHLMTYYLSRNITDANAFLKLLVNSLADKLQQDERESDYAVGSFVEDIIAKYPTIEITHGTSEELHTKIVASIKEPQVVSKQEYNKQQTKSNPFTVSDANLVYEHNKEIASGSNLIKTPENAFTLVSDTVVLTSNDTPPYLKKLADSNAKASDKTGDQTILDPVKFLSVLNTDKDDEEPKDLKNVVEHDIDDTTSATKDQVASVSTDTEDNSSNVLSQVEPKTTLPFSFISKGYATGISRFNTKNNKLNRKLKLSVKTKRVTKYTSKGRQQAWLNQLILLTHLT